jgi:hypothetical protein
MPVRGLTVSSNGTLLLDGQRFRNVGLNWGGAIVRIFSQPSPTGCEYTPAAEQDAGLDYLQSLGVKVIRVKALPYWPAQWTVGVLGGKAWNVATAGDREAHYLKIDAFLAKAKARGIGVILNTFFRHATISDLVGGTVRGWLSAGNVRTFATTITQEVVTRYANEEAVYGWEFSNELNHYNDYTAGAWPTVETSYGTAASYPTGDSIFNTLTDTSDLATVLSWWSGVVSAIDPTRLRLSGNGPCSYTRQGGTPGTATPIRELLREIDRDNPLNSNCIHYYGSIGMGSHDFKGLDALLTGCKHWARQRGRAFVLGEIGNQPRKISSVSAGTITLAGSGDRLNNVAGNEIELVGCGAWTGKHTLLSVAADRQSATIADTGATAFSGSGRLVDQTEARVADVLAQIVSSDTDLTLWWQYDTDPLTPVAESINSLPYQAQLIAAANARLAEI